MTQINWHSKPFSELGAEVPNAFAGGPFGSNLVSRDYVESGVPVIRGQNLGNGRWIGGEFVFVSEAKAKKLEVNKARPGDLVFTQRGTLGQVAIVPQEPFFEYIVSQSQMKATLDPKLADARYFYYFFTSKEQVDYILANAMQTGVPHSNLGQLRSHPIVLPPLTTQKRIADILGSLDDKIELNRRMNATLEAMARAVFKAWFVDFEPVHAKAAGASHFPGMPQPLFDTLPSTFSDSELGPIPDGWTVQPMDKAFEINPGRALKKGAIAPYLGMSDMPTVGHIPENWFDREFGSGMRFINGDTLVARITPCLENGKTAFVDFLPDGVVGWGSTEYIVLRPLPQLPNVYAYCLARTTEFRDFAIANMTGTSGRQRVSAQSFTHFAIVKPPEPIAKEFGQFATPLFELASANARANRTLAEIRDTLLPKLISGELRVPDAEAMVEDAT